MTTRVFRIPFANTPQRFAISLSGKSYIVQNVWNPESQSWELSMYDGDTEQAIFVGMPMTSGLDLLSQFKHLGIGGSLFIYTDGNELAVPTETNLGVESNLYYLVDEA